MTLLNKALARREPQEQAKTIEGGFHRDTGLARLWLERLVIVVAALLLGLILWQRWQPLLPKTPEAKPQKPAVSAEAPPAAKAPEPAARPQAADPFFKAPSKAEPAPVLPKPVAAKPAAVQEAPFDAAKAPATLSYTGHFYASDPKLRWVILNGHKLRQGEGLPGLKVLEIAPDSANIQLGEKRFWLNALTNWPTTGE
ncbi:general secretion pathway protein GspB [Gallaecimonas kandeliae]|uniref:general secretion pathway protein GspB n=1 Tax=Gallaecimonas kandeliae TaxID=3029055 RepID=UPI0026487D1A|nr:general secretion pathway protein GspB [Gallaecimonas kandeliae]WKE64760.1 general secretion pathway protein GspB [Gallaecimonas kandeliae]